MIRRLGVLALLVACCGLMGCGVTGYGISANSKGTGATEGKYDKMFVQNLQGQHVRAAILPTEVILALIEIPYIADAGNTNNKE